MCHLGAEKQKRVARMSLYWPNMNKDIDDMVQRCGVCLKYRPALPRDKLMDIEDKRRGPWEQVGVDLMHWGGKEYVVLVDYYSNYPELAMLTSTSSGAVIKHIKAIFSSHGIPRTLCSDNGPPVQFGRICSV